MLSGEDNGEPIYIGFGLNPKGCSKLLVQKALIDSFNQESLNDNLISPSTSIWKTRDARRFNKAFAIALRNEKISNLDDRDLLDRAIDGLTGFPKPALDGSKILLAGLYESAKKNAQNNILMLDFQRLNSASRF